jgi:16S rRNA (guanine1207-N2)-methyltransferase
VFAVSQIIERNLHRRKSGGSVLWINPERDDCWRAVKPVCSSLKLFSQDYGNYVFLQQAGADIEFAAIPRTDEDKYDWVIVNLPRQKALLNMMLDCAATLLAKDGVLWLAGENKAGIKSADKQLKSHFGQVRKLDNARHCSLFEADARLNQDLFNPRNYRNQWVLNCNNSGITVISYPGVFAHGRLDDGTALLLHALATTELNGDVLDFASGAGIIGACIAAQHKDTTITLLDTNAMALKACAETLEANQLEGLVLASDGLSGINDSFDVVVSNPPIHVGARTDNQLGMRLLESVHEHIRPGGRLILVANVHLPYENWLSARFKRFSGLAANDNYKVIVATK